MDCPSWTIERQWNGRVVAKRSDRTAFQVILADSHVRQDDPSRTLVNATDAELVVYLDWLARTGRLWSLT